PRGAPPTPAGSPRTLGRPFMVTTVTWAGPGATLETEYVPSGEIWPDLVWFSESMMLTSPPGSGWPSRVTFPVTVPGPPQPATKSSTAAAAPHRPLRVCNHFIDQSPTSLSW